jgi:hypothetical protein
MVNIIKAVVPIRGELEYEIGLLEFQQLLSYGLPSWSLLDTHHFEQAPPIPWLPKVKL